MGGFGSNKGHEAVVYGTSGGVIVWPRLGGLAGMLVKCS
jgi:hypothetical protein